MRALIVISLCLLTTTIISAQKAEDFERWLGNVDEAYQKADYADQPVTDYKTRVREARFELQKNRIAYHLLSDKFFLPIFGIPYDNLKESQRNKILRKLNGVAERVELGSRTPKYPWARRLLLLVKDYFYRASAYESAVREIRELRALRTEYDRIMQEISTPATETRLASASRLISKEMYQKMLPAEIIALENKITSIQQTRANQNIRESFAKIQTDEKNYATLLVYRSFREENEPLFLAASPEVRQSVNDQVRSTIAGILPVVLEEEMVNLSGMEIGELNDFTRTFKDRYDRFFDFEEITAAIARIKRVKTALVISQREEFERQLASANDLDILGELKEKYLSFTEKADRSIIALENRLSERAAVLRQKEKERAAQAIVEQERADVKAMESLGLSEFETMPLFHEDLVQKMFRGQFYSIDLERDDVSFLLLIDNYMKTYARMCADHLPANRVEITEQYCATSVTKKTLYGTFISSDCIDIRQRGTGLYADPTLYSAFNTVDGLVALKAAKSPLTIIKDMYDRQRDGKMKEWVRDAKSLPDDMQLLIANNGCTNKSLQRFEQNLIRFAREETPISIHLRFKPKTLAADIPQDWYRLVNDLVVADARGWTFDFVSGSIENVNVLRDDQGRPAQITLTYQLKELFGTRKDIINITFNRGRPECILFPNWSNMGCNPANRRTVSNFIAGRYAKK